MEKYQSTRLAVFLTFIFYCKIASGQLFTSNGNRVIIALNESIKCNAELECTNCYTGKVCIQKDNNWIQFGHIICDETTDTYCNNGTCSKTPQSSCIPPSFVCMADGVYPDLSDCTRYYICANDVLRTNQCPWNNIYDHKTGTCKYRRNSTDCVTINCTSREGYKFVYPLDDRIYGICLLGKPYMLKRCKDYEKYDLTQGRCVRFCRTAGNQPPDDLTKPESCGKYILCAEVSPGVYKPVEQFCASNEGYDPKKNGCSKDAPCLHYSTTTTAPTKSTTPRLTTTTKKK